MVDASLTWYDVFRCLNINHVASGAKATGLFSLVGWLTAGGFGAGGGWRWMIGNTWDGGRGHGNGRDVVSTALLVLAVCAGLCVALYWIYGRLEEYAHKTIRMAQHVVLDVGRDDDEPHAASDGERPSHGTATGDPDRALYEHVD